jgi:hypothetical protein
MQDILDETVECFRYRPGYLKVGLEFGIPPRLVPLIKDVSLNQEYWNQQDHQH